MTRRRAGFTLIELVVALAIAGLAVAVVPASMARLQAGMEYRATVRAVLSGLKTARLEAARSGVAVPFSVDLEARSFSVPGQQVAPVPAQIELGLIVAEREQSGGRGSIRFYPDGSSTGGSIILRRENGGGVRLRVDWLLGRITQEPLA